MAEILELLGGLLWAGWVGLLDYLAAHVLLCLLPAFVIAGFISAAIPTETVSRYLGPTASKWVSYPAAAFGGFVLAVCSCTILPLFAGIWKRGAGLGPAVTFLFVGPSVNILAIAYTGTAIGMDIAVARIALSVLFGVGIGLIMAWVFRTERASQAIESDPFARSSGRIASGVWGVFLLLLALLITGTLQIDLLREAWVTIPLGIELPASFTSALEALNLSLQGALLILMLVVIAPLAVLGFERVLDRINRWSYAALAMVALTLLLAAPVVREGSVEIGLTGRFVGVALLLVAIGAAARKTLPSSVLLAWFWETWRFIKQIVPLLLAGVFVAGMAKVVLPAEWVQSLAGRNTLAANLVGVLFGVFMYFPTLVEVPIARMFLDLGMHRGPLLAYLMADPGLSLQSLLVTGRILGGRKTATYAALVALFSTLAGALFGLLIA